MMKRILLWIAGLIVLGALAGWEYAGRRAEMIRKNDAITAAWVQLDAVLQRRADLVPSVVALLEKAPGKDPAVLAALTGARSAWLASTSRAERIAAAVALDQSLLRALAAAEARPELKPDEEFLRLRAAAAGTEFRLEAERRRYDEAILDYNSYLRFPLNRLFAPWAGFRPYEAAYPVPSGKVSASVSP